MIFVERTAAILAVCQIIRERISTSSGLFYPSDSGYNRTIIRYGVSSIIPSTCSVEPGDVNDVSTVVSPSNLSYAMIRLISLVENHWSISNSIWIEWWWTFIKSRI